MPSRVSNKPCGITSVYLVSGNNGPTQSATWMNHQHRLECFT